jgi:hypothetical protein
MKDRKPIPFFFISIMMFLTLGVFPMVAYATHSYIKVNSIPRYGFLGGTSAHAEVKSARIPEGPHGRCYIKSYTSPGTTINVIGWTWWQCDVLDANNNIVNTTQALPARAVTASSTQDDIGILFTGGVKIKTHGTHDFNHTGSSPSPWRPYNVVIWQYHH